MRWDDSSSVSSWTLVDEEAGQANQSTSSAMPTVHLKACRLLHRHLLSLHSSRRQQLPHHLWLKLLRVLSPMPMRHLHPEGIVANRNKQLAEAEAPVVGDSSLLANWFTTH